jgi:putative transposase
MDVREHGVLVRYADDALVLIFGRRRLASVLAEYADHYNVHRPRRALGQAPPLRSVESAAILSAGKVVRRDRLGGLIHEYGQVA